MSHRIVNVKDREKLPPRRPPYWHKLSTGRHVGFRRMTKDSAGTWLAQAYDPATQKQTRRSLGSFDDLPDHARFDAAKKAAEEWFDHLSGGGSVETSDVVGACRLYVEHIRDEKGDVAADELAARFRRRVDSDPIARIELLRLRRPHVVAWRRRLEREAVAGGEDRARSPGSVNRDMTALRAALNHAREHDAVINDNSWRAPLKPIKAADRRRDVYLDAAQRSALAAHASGATAVFIRTLAVIPLRPGALAALRVGDFDRRLDVLTISKDKAGQDRRITLPKTTSAMLGELARDKLPGAPLLARDDGQPWTKDAWKGPIKAAARAAGLPEGTVAYALRHSAITDLVVGGLDLMTVALLAGTSIAMIQKHYGHLRAAHATAALERLVI